jgi:hypothetical protein
MKKAKEFDLEKVFVEEVTERIGKHVLASKVRDATIDDIKKELKNHKNGKCSHSVVEDEKGWLYDFRSCAICGAGLGTV